MNGRVLSKKQIKTYIEQDNNDDERFQKLEIDVKDLGLIKISGFLFIAWRETQIVRQLSPQKILHAAT